MTAFARDVAWRMHHRACLVERGYSDIAADLWEIAGLNMADMKSNFQSRQLEILAGYGYQQVEHTKPFAYADSVAVMIGDAFTPLIVDRCFDLLDAPKTNDKVMAIRQRTD